MLQVIDQGGAVLWVLNQRFVAAAADIEGITSAFQRVRGMMWAISKTTSTCWSAQDTLAAGASCCDRTTMNRCAQLFHREADGLIAARSGKPVDLNRIGDLIDMAVNTIEMVVSTVLGGAASRFARSSESQNTAEQTQYDRMLDLTRTASNTYAFMHLVDSKETQEILLKLTLTELEALVRSNDDDSFLKKFCCFRNSILTEAEKECVMKHEMALLEATHRLQRGRKAKG